MLQLLKKLKRSAAGVGLVAVMTLAPAGAAVAAPSLPPASVVASSAAQQSACQGLNQLDATQGCNTKTSNNVVGDLTHTVVNILSVIVGAVCVIMVIVAGLRYVTSAGDSNGVAGAKSTLTYALVGLVIVALAQFIVHFVLSNV